MGISLSPKASKGQTDNVGPIASDELANLLITVVSFFPAGAPLVHSWARQALTRTLLKSMFGFSTAMSGSSLDLPREILTSIRSRAELVPGLGSVARRRAESPSRRSTGRRAWRWTIFPTRDPSEKVRVLTVVDRAIVARDVSTDHSRKKRTEI